MSTSHDLLLQAAKDGNLQVIQFLLNQNVTVSSLHFVCLLSNNRLEIMRMLSETVDPEMMTAVDEKRSTLLINCVEAAGENEEEDVELFKFVLTNMTERMHPMEVMSFADKYGDTALMLACAYGNMTLVEVMLLWVQVTAEERLRLLTQTNNNHMNAFMLAVRHNHLHVVDMILRLCFRDLRVLLDVDRLSGEHIISIIDSKEMLALLAKYYVRLFSSVITGVPVFRTEEPVDLPGPRAEEDEWCDVDGPAPPV